MSSTGAAFDPCRTFMLINDEPTAVAVPVGPDFWEQLSQSKVANSSSGRLVSVTEQTQDWTNWEMHPASDEILIMLCGAMELIVEADGKDNTISLHALNAYIVPRGLWHTARIKAPGQMLAITGGAGTQHRPLV
jgi:mannose-6-phosphate isomerase-like protein (cupin superfamily)